MPRSRAFAVLAALLMSLAGVAALPVATEAATRDVHAWVEISSTRPGPGCEVFLTIEVRASGNAVSNAEVVIALFNGSEAVQVDRQYTDGNGVAHLSFTASGIGADGWLDLNISGSYLKGYSIGATEGNGCDAASKFDEISGTIAGASSSSAGFPPYYTYVQQRNLSCEFAAVQIATGGAVSEYDIEAFISLSPNPHWGYRGNIHGLWGNTDDYGIYPEPLAAALPNFGYHGEVFYGGWSNDQLVAHLDAGAPVIVWMALWGDMSHVEETDGVSYTLTPGMHVMVAYEYDENNVYLSDPGTGSLVAYSWGSFLDLYGVLDGMSMAVYAG
jgi:uncharacterized protein YvpB